MISKKKSDELLKKARNEAQSAALNQFLQFAQKRSPELAQFLKGEYKAKGNGKKSKGKGKGKNNKKKNKGNGFDSGNEAAGVCYEHNFYSQDGPADDKSDHGTI